LFFDLSGVEREYAQGGNGSIGSATEGQPGLRGTGNGGNGSYAASNGGSGGAGGTGTVVVRYPAREAQCETCNDDISCDEATDCPSGFCTEAPDASCIDADR
jgi:hypothetical protein